MVANAQIIDVAFDKTIAYNENIRFKKMMGIIYLTVFIIIILKVREQWNDKSDFF